MHCYVCYWRVLVAVWNRLWDVMFNSRHLSPGHSVFAWPRMLGSVAIFRSQKGPASKNVWKPCSIRLHAVDTGKYTIFFTFHTLPISGPGSSDGIATDYGLDGLGSMPVGTRFSALPDRPWGPRSLLYIGYRVYPGGKVRPERAADDSPPSSAAVMEE